MTAVEAAWKLLDRKKAQRALEAEIDDLLAYLTEQHESGAMDELTYEPGVYGFPGMMLTRSTRRSWQYSPAIKKLQKLEQENGLATAKTTEFWTVKLL